MHFYDHEGEACNYCEHVSSQVSRLAYFLKLFLAGCPPPFHHLSPVFLHTFTFSVLSPSLLIFYFIYFQLNLCSDKLNCFNFIRTFEFGVWFHVGRSPNMCSSPYPSSIGTAKMETNDLFLTLTLTDWSLRFIFRWHRSSIIFHPTIPPHPHKTNCNFWCSY